VSSLRLIDERVALAAHLRGAGVRVFVAATGAGAGIQEVLWRVPGCSSFFVGAVFPYGPREIDGFLGLRPERYASEETAIDLAHQSYLHALDAADPASRAIGVGLSASVASLTPHRGDHRVHVAVVTSAGAVGETAVLAKGGPERRELDGSAADELGLRALFHAAGIAEGPAVEDWSARSRARFFARPYWDRDGGRHTLALLPGDAPIFPGAFNPPHPGHLAIASTDRGHARPAVFAICATPPHKEALTTGELLRRAKLLHGHDRLFTEGDPLYLDKARLLPGRTFLIGADALVRMLDPKWGTRVGSMLEELARLGTQFRVNGRLVEGAYLSPEEAIAKVPEAFRPLFVPVAGRWDLSSSDVRAHGAACA
jgi:hypothetical protein